MTETKMIRRIGFSPISPQDKDKYEELLFGETERGCEFSFANLYLWGQQNIAFEGGHAILFSRFGEREIYLFPLGQTDKRGAIDRIINDAETRGSPLCISGIGPSAKKLLEELYPERFSFSTSEGSYDYVYSIDDLAELKGKRYHGKRNHLSRFRELFPDHTFEPITSDNLNEVWSMAEGWYKKRELEDRESDFEMEKAAIRRALGAFDKLGLEGLILRGGGEVLAFTLASRLSEDTFDVHFEKAKADIQGAYPAINCALANYIRGKYPEVKYLDREEDMGHPGLRKAKQSYHPHHMVIKYRACLSEAEHDN